MTRSRSPHSARPNGDDPVRCQARTLSSSARSTCSVTPTSRLVIPWPCAVRAVKGLGCPVCSTCTSRFSYGFGCSARLGCSASSNCRSSISARVRAAPVPPSAAVSSSSRSRTIRTAQSVMRMPSCVTERRLALASCASAFVRRVRRPPRHAPASRCRSDRDRCDLPARVDSDWPRCASGPAGRRARSIGRASSPGGDRNVDCGTPLHGESPHELADRRVPRKLVQAICST